MRIARNTFALVATLSILLSPFKIITPSAGAVNLFDNYDESFVIYEKLNLEESGLAQAVFDLAVEGYSEMVQSGKANDCGIISIADLSQPSTEKRLYIIDIENHRLLFNTWVAHGKNTGELYAKNFSNIPESNQSSLGFYQTGDTYIGKHGLSLQLHGMESGLNDKALDRAIVIHGADYVSEKFIRQTGRLGRSLGCPAVANELAEPVIETIKGGTLFFVYHPNYN
jgi:hypothetical protein